MIFYLILKGGLQSKQQVQFNHESTAFSSSSIDVRNIIAAAMKRIKKNPPVLLFYQRSSSFFRTDSQQRDKVDQTNSSEIFYSLKDENICRIFCDSSGRILRDHNIKRSFTFKLFITLTWSFNITLQLYQEILELCFLRKWADKSAVKRLTISEEFIKSTKQISRWNTQQIQYHSWSIFVLTLC